jgi:hypothetical protein
MTSSQKALLRYGPLAAGALFCALLAGLGCVRAIPALSGPVKKVCAAAVAAGMAIQGAALFPRKWESRLIVKPHPLAAGSVMLFAGAALLIALLFSGCSPATATPQPLRTMNFTTANRQELGTYSALGVPKSIAAQSLSGERTDKNRPLARDCDPWACGSASQSMRAQTALASVRRAELNVVLSRRQ